MGLACSRRSPIAPSCAVVEPRSDLVKDSASACDDSTEATPIASRDAVVEEPSSESGKDSSSACAASAEVISHPSTDANASIAAVASDPVGDSCAALAESPDISTAREEITDVADVPTAPAAEPQPVVPGGTSAQAESSDDEPAERVSPVAAPSLGPELPPAEKGEDKDGKDEKSLDQLLTEKLGETNNLLTNLRSNLTTVSLRVDHAIRMKEDANSQLSTGELDTALRLYLSALWLLHPDDPPLPKALAKSDRLGGALLTKALECCFHKFDAKLPGKDDVTRAVEDDASQAEIPDDERPVSMEELLAKSSDLRRGIYRNTARVCNELQEWTTSKQACNFVLSVDAADIKALWLLAKAQDGESDLGQAISTLNKLLKIDPNNRPARQLLEGLKQRKKREAAAYGGMFDRAGDQDRRRMYPQKEMRAKEEARKDAEGRLRLEDIAKLDPNNWAEHIGKLNAKGKSKAAFDGKECAKSMPNFSWMKHVLPTMNDEGKPQLDKL